MITAQFFPPRPCPVCGARESKLLFRQSFEELSGPRLLSGYDVAICEGCGAGFADRIPPQSAFDQYYRDQSKYDYDDHDWQAPPATEPKFQDIAATIAGFIPTPGARILEIGCASGGLLKLLQESGFPNVFGVDPSPGCIHAARRLYGLPCEVGGVFTLSQPEAPYDVLILTGVLEHIRDLALAVERFQSLLRDGGRIYLEVPDASRYDSRLDAPFQEFSVEHINFFSPDSLTNLMHAHNFLALASAAVMRPLHEVLCPCLYGVYEKTPRPWPTKRDTVTESGLRAYIDGCQAEDARIRDVIRRAVPPGGRIIVWGAGAHTLRLLASGGLDPAAIALFVDSNPKYQRRDILGIPVAPPEAVKGRPEPILISSRSSQNEIRLQIRRALGLRNPLIVLY